ncbi:MAG: hypothetical protein Q4D43_09660, partial [Clostridia bacterium]|nr:hypothetical protein [Clostridia bacterium]
IRTGWSRAASSTRLLKGAGCALAQTEGEKSLTSLYQHSFSALSLWAEKRRFDCALDIWAQSN